LRKGNAPQQARGGKNEWEERREYTRNCTGLSRCRHAQEKRVEDRRVLPVTLGKEKGESTTGGVYSRKIVPERKKNDTISLHWRRKNALRSACKMELLLEEEGVHIEPGGERSLIELCARKSMGRKPLIWGGPACRKRERNELSSGKET